MAIKVSITKDLEARLRKGDDPGPLLEEIISLLDKAIGAGSRGKKEVHENGTGLGFKDLLAWFHSCFGPDFSPPIKPDPSYVVRMVNLAKSKGVTKESVEQICTGARRSKPGPYSLGAVLWRAEEYYKAGDPSLVDGRDGRGGIQDGEVRDSNVHTGREHVYQDQTNGGENGE